MKKLYKWLCEQFPGCEIKLTKDDIHCNSSDLQIYVGKFTSPYVGYLGHCHYKDIICNFKCTSQQSVINNIKNSLEA